MSVGGTLSSDQEFKLAVKKVPVGRPHCPKDRTFLMAQVELYVGLSILWHLKTGGSLISPPYSFSLNPPTQSHSSIASSLPVSPAVLTCVRYCGLKLGPPPIQLLPGRNPECYTAVHWGSGFPRNSTVAGAPSAGYILLLERES